MLQSIRRIKSFSLAVLGAVSLMMVAMTMGLGCTYDHPLSEMACDSDDQCEGAAHCQDGYCVANEPRNGNDETDAGDIEDMPEDVEVSPEDIGVGPEDVQDTPGDVEVDSGIDVEVDSGIDVEADCDGSTRRCDGQCVDILSDDDHCGECNNSCVVDAQGATISLCESGQCVDQCPDSQNICGTEELSCVDTMNDDDHCGECDNDCGDGHYCDSGTCTPLPCWEDAEPFGGGVGTVEDPHTICSAQHLQRVGDDDSFGDYFLLYDDIEMEGISFEPIGDSAFEGHFDGDGRTIRNLTIKTDTGRAGLFREIGSDGVVVDLKLMDVAIEGEHRVGAMVGQLHGVIEGCEVSGDIEGLSHVGGLVGEMSAGSVGDSNSSADVTATGMRVGGLIGEVTAGTIASVHAEGDVFGHSDSVGGLIGRIHTSDVFVSDCSAAGEVHGNGHVGGLVGTHRGEIDDCHAESTVSADEGRVAGFVGANRAQISNSSAHGDVTGGGSQVGGFVGHNIGDIRRSSAHGDISMNEYQRVGGFVGDNTSDGRVSESYATGTITTASSDRVGGFAGLVRRGAEVIDSYSLGEVIASNGIEIGGFYGVNHDAGAGGRVYTSFAAGHVDASSSSRTRGFGYNLSIVNNCYWRSEGSDMNDNHTTGLSNAQFLDTDNFSGFDFNEVWEMSGEGPVLKWQNGGD